MYGIVLVTALIAVGWEDETDFDVLLFVLGTVFVFWLAHIYAAVVASREIAAPVAGHARRDRPAASRHTYGMLVAMLIPALLLMLGRGRLGRGVHRVLSRPRQRHRPAGRSSATRTPPATAAPGRGGSPASSSTTLLGALVIVLSILVH